jgi:hypothetical protein
MNRRMRELVLASSQLGIELSTMFSHTSRLRL